MTTDTLAKPKALTAAFVKLVTEPGKYHDGKGTGLFLLVKPTGGRFWLQRITIRGKRRELGLGSPPVVTLAEAREQALENKRMVRSGGDPLREKRRAKAVLTFEEAARKTHAELSPTWKNPKDRAAFLSTLETYIFPHFGSVPLPDVTSADIRQAILAAREKVPHVARKLVYRVSYVFKWGIAEGMCSGNPSTADALALPQVERKPKHRKALAYSEVAGCIETVHASKAWTATKLSIEFLILTASRSGEVRMAHWDEIDMDTATWEVPAERMKMQRPHRVPLSGRAMEILGEAAKLRDGSGLVFPSVRGKALSDMTLSKLVKELGFDADIHGFRTSFRTWAQERTNYPREVAEAALAHKTGDAVEQAYARSDVFEKRRNMMESWAAFLSESDAKVTRIG
ncbi:site-specific integrase [Tropicimonas sp. IMCC6043]|uniref:tyrosine-type recombinase/integrase n=1 Tax=Tropicimonas sp. IMCC6043 TaxID=2510645 RepID=UPI00101CC3F0|nr:site-specific integrase [Tropicimonas sp. IMCC6043]RYH07742.1 site-specific integrase [Tropicimonas sp. IMCC6043]